MDTESSESEDWLAGATIEAECPEISLGDVCVPLDGLDLPEDDDPYVA